MEMAAPPELTDLPLYANDATLCAKWRVLYPTWQKTFSHVDVMAEVRAAHAWEMANPAKSKKDRPRFLTNWLKRHADQTAQPTQLTPEQERRLRFQAKYETELSPNWPGGKSHMHAESWNKVIDAMSDDEMDAVFAFMLQHKPDNRRPIVPNFWHALKAVRAQFDEKPFETCAICTGSGFIVLPAVQKRMPDKTVKFVFGEEDAGPLYDYAFPCRCTAGIARGRHMKVSPASCDAAWEYWKDVRKSAGYQQETEAMTLEQFLAKRRHDQFSPNSILKDTKIASLQAAGLAKNGGLYGQRGSTIKEWSKRQEKAAAIDAIQKACASVERQEDKRPTSKDRSSDTASDGFQRLIPEPTPKPAEPSDDDLPF
jgi:hypothetical protein